MDLNFKPVLRLFQCFGKTLSSTPGTVKYCLTGPPSVHHGTHLSIEFESGLAHIPNVIIGLPLTYSFREKLKSSDQRVAGQATRHSPATRVRAHFA